LNTCGPKRTAGFCFYKVLNSKRWSAMDQRVHTLVGHTDPVWTVDFSPDSSLLVSAGWDGTARIWDVQTGAQLRVLTHPEKKSMYWAEFSPDGETIVTGSELDDRVYLWRVDLNDVIERLCAEPLADLTPEQRTQYDITDDQPVCPQW
jgi:WD40 repeat protein